MRLLNLRINFYLLRTFCPHLGRFFLGFFCFFCVLFLLSLRFGQISPLAFFRWFLLRPRIGMMSLVIVFPVITAFHSCCLSYHVFDQVNLWLAWVRFETAIFWQCSPGTVETQRLYPLCHGPRGHGKNHLKKARSEIWSKRSERRNNTQKKKIPRCGQKVHNK